MDRLLTVPELVELRIKYNNLKLRLPIGEVKNMRWDEYIAKEQDTQTASIVAGEIFTELESDCSHGYFSDKWSCKECRLALKAKYGK